VDIEQFIAQLNNGVLTITAPKDIKKLKESVRRIPITTDAPPVEETATLSTTIGASSEENISNQNLEIPVSD
jgi:hypothetical protein